MKDNRVDIVAALNADMIGKKAVTIDWLLNAFPNSTQDGRTLEQGLS